MASFFSKLFGIPGKQNYSELIPEPPKFSLAPGSQQGYVSGLQQLIDVFQNRASGNDQFDYMKYIYGPQEEQLRRLFGIDTQPGDIYSTKSGSLPQTMASMNQRGLLDTGTSALIEGQQRADLNSQLAQLFGQAKVGQKQDVDAAYSNLHQLFPEQFQAQNIQSQVDYDNAMNSYNALLQRNAATAEGQATRNSAVSGALQGGLGALFGAAGGGMAGMGMFGGTPLAGGGGAGFATGALGNLFGQTNPYAQLKNIIQTNDPFKVGQTTTPGSGGSPLIGPKPQKNLFNQFAGV